jgi:hypothetical protein
MQESRDPKPAQDVAGDTGIYDESGSSPDPLADNSLRDPGATQSDSERERISTEIEEDIKSNTAKPI